MRSLLTSIFLVAFLGAASAAEPEFMSIEQMKAEIIGHSLNGRTDGGDEYVEHYASDGTIVGLSQKAGRYQGTWSFRQDGLMCFRYGEDALAGGCVHLSRAGNRIGFVRVDGSHEPSAVLSEGMATQLK